MSACVHTDGGRRLLASFPGHILPSFTGATSTVFQCGLGNEVMLEPLGWFFIAGFTYVIK